MATHWVPWPRARNFSKYEDRMRGHVLASANRHAHASVEHGTQKRATNLINALSESNTAVEMSPKLAASFGTPNMLGELGRELQTGVIGRPTPRFARRREPDRRPAGEQSGISCAAGQIETVATQAVYGEHVSHARRPPKSRAPLPMLIRMWIPAGLGRRYAAIGSAACRAAPRRRRPAR